MQAKDPLQVARREQVLLWVALWCVGFGVKISNRTSTGKVDDSYTQT